jgi:restriction system protein
VKINEVINNLAKENGLSLWQIDEVWWLATSASSPSEPETETEQDEEEGEGVPAEVESQLEEFLISNWEKIPEFGNLEILQEDGEYIGQQYDTKEVGRIDLLCKNKKTGDFIVIELKKGRESDKVVGQTLRYIGWVKKNLATQNQGVYGLIITYEDDPRLRYSLEPIKNLIQLKFYKISITIS